VPISWKVLGSCGFIFRKAEEAPLAVMVSNIANRKNTTKRSGKTFPLLDTLAQLRKTEDEDANSFKFDRSTEAADLQKLNLRARAKYFTTSFILKLIDIDSPLRKSYWNTFHCCETLTLAGGKVTGKYCKTRWCIVCNRIRTAKLIRKYLPVIENWTDKNFVTLTIVSIPGPELKVAIDKMELDFKRIQEVMRKRKSSLIGVRKLECTYNQISNEYHPHYHVIMQDKANAQELLSQWLERNPNSKDYAQRNKPADDRCVRELFKYFTKVISPAGDKSRDGRKIITSALDVIFQSVVGRRTFQSFGFFLPHETEDEETKHRAEQYADEATYEWINDLYNWIDLNTGEALTTYEPSPGFIKLLNNIQ